MARTWLWTSCLTSASAFASPSGPPDRDLVAASTLSSSKDSFKDSFKESFKEDSKEDSRSKDAYGLTVPSRDIWKSSGVLTARAAAICARNALATASPSGPPLLRDAASMAVEGRAPLWLLACSRTLRICASCSARTEVLGRMSSLRGEVPCGARECESASCSTLVRESWSISWRARLAKASFSALSLATRASATRRARRSVSLRASSNPSCSVASLSRNSCSSFILPLCPSRNRT
mmetsp:Transcript_17912/g.43272  ORF Transcript_17912/g.43272 Transcript_17912/m.43272 type:complete len:236 (-) Transcript_17912:533-1240(-)